MYKRINLFYYKFKFINIYLDIKSTLMIITFCYWIFGKKYIKIGESKMQ
jgi:hypothetical protein